MRIPWLADVLRAAGLAVVEVPGWRGHGSGTWQPTGGIWHATADGAAQNPVSDAKDDAAAISIIRNGRPGLPGPIANAYVNRAGVWYLIADGKCNTAYAGTAGPLHGLGNFHLLGIEFENDNRGEPWPGVQYASALTGWSAICRKLGWQAGRIAGHKEHDPRRKSDPLGIDMNTARADLAAAISGRTISMGVGAEVWDDMNGQYAIWRVAAIAELEATYTGGPQKGKPVPLVALLTGMRDALAASAGREAASAVREQDMHTALKETLALLRTLSSGGSGDVDVNVILAKIEERSSDVTGLLSSQSEELARMVAEQATRNDRIAQLERRVAELVAELDQRNDAMAAIAADPAGGR